MNGIDPGTLAAFAAAALVALAGFLVAHALTNTDRRRLKTRLARAAGQSSARRASDTGTEYASLRRDTSTARMRRLDAIAHHILPHPQALRDRLSRTGKKISLGQYALGCLGVALVETLIRPLFVPLSPMAAVLIGIVVGLGVPHLYVSHLIKRRLRRFIAQFPDAIDLIVRGLKSGLPTTESIRIVGEEFGDPVGVEFRYVTDQVRFGQTLEEALWEAAKRLDTPEFRFFCISLSVQRETGGNLGETLENLSDVLRKRRQMQLKIRAMSSEAKASTMILGSLPFIMFGLLYLVNHSYVMQLITDQRGMILTGIGLCSLGLGVFVMIRMAKFPDMIAGINIDDVIVAMAALAAALNVYVLYRALLVRNPMGTRIKSLTARREELRRAMTGPRRRATTETGRERSMGLMRRVVVRLSLLGTHQSQKTSLMLAQAGWRSRDSLVLYFFLKLAMPFALGGAAILYIYVLKLVHLSSFMAMAASLGCVVLGAYGPDLYVRNAVSKRKQKLQRGLPDTLDLLVICAEAGQTLDAALGRVAREMTASCPEIADEFGLTALELGLLPQRRQALDHLNARTDMASIRGVVNTLLQTERYGTPLAASLRVLAAEYRHERLMKAEEKAAKLPAKLTVPMIVFIMPALFVVLIGPAIIRTIDLLGKFH